VSEYDKAYRAGVMAERRRAMLVALRATTRKGYPSDEGHSLAHQLGRAGDQIPAPLPTEQESWSVFGERRLVRELPTMMEGFAQPFTDVGKRYISRMEILYYKSVGGDKLGAKMTQWEDQVHTSHRDEQLADAPERIAELEKLVETLSLQLSGVIS